MFFHSFHIVEKSPWPLTGSIRALIFTTGLINIIHNNSIYIFIIALLIILFTIIQWWRDIIRETTFQGNHTIKVIKGLKLGIILFIISEIFFFLSFFWSYFHSSLSPNIELGTIWPPNGVIPFNPFHVPLLNTTILLSSGATVTWSHHRIINKNYKQAYFSLSITILLGIYFSILQGWEYYESSFSIRDRTFGTTFFVSTGFHGLHVLIGTRFLFVNLIRINIGHLSNLHHFRFEAAAWYWHFVDVVWLFLYTFVYW